MFVADMQFKHKNKQTNKQTKMSVKALRHTLTSAYFSFVKGPSFSVHKVLQFVRIKLQSVSQNYYMS